MHAALCVKNGGMQCRRWIIPHPVQINSSQRATVAKNYLKINLIQFLPPIDDTVRVEHWDQFENEQFACMGSQWVVREEELDQT